MLPPGIHQFPFKFKLQEGIASSAHLMTKFVKLHVKYKIKATVFNVFNDRAELPPIKFENAFLVNEIPKALPSPKYSAV